MTEIKVVTQGGVVVATANESGQNWEFADALLAREYQRPAIELVDSDEEEEGVIGEVAKRYPPGTAEHLSNWLFSLLDLGYKVEGVQWATLS